MLPFMKTSKSKKGMRRAHHAVKPVQVNRCPKCGQSKLPHRLCSNCGYVNKSLSLIVAEEQENA
jgi:large subunit ribosomal protein L32